MQSPNGNNCSINPATPVRSTSSTPPPSKRRSVRRPNDDLELMLQHENFPHLLDLAHKIKTAHVRIQSVTTGFEPSQALAKYSLAPSEVMKAVTRLQNQFVSSETSRETIRPGVYPMTDILVMDSIETLQREWEHCQKWLEASESTRLDKDPTAEPAVSEPPTLPKKRKASGANSGSKKEAIAVKYSKWQTDILMNWMIQHVDEPFPKQGEIHQLMDMTGLTQSQVINWTTNVRKRNRKATCQNGKKPHHFIDFVFLAHDRERRARKASSIAAAHPLMTGLDSFQNAPRENILAVPPSPCACAVPTRQAASSYSYPSPPSYPQPTYNHTSLSYFANQTPDFKCVHTVPFSPGTMASSPPRCAEDSAIQEHSQTLMQEEMWEIHDDFDPVPMEEESDEFIMEEFAKSWLFENPMDVNDPDSLTVQQAPCSTMPLLNDLGLLPSVTEDSHEKLHRNRTASFDLGELEDEDIDAWAADMGLAIEIQ